MKIYHDREGRIEKLTDTRIQNDQTRERKDSLENRIIDKYDFLTNSAASMDCTGLEYKTAKSDEEREHYEQVYSYETKTE